MRDARIVPRARMHAALGEPVRLAIVDQLALGDASPGELAAAAHLPTNLLAHHLRVLEQAGLIRRRRSEGDRRRWYVQLRFDDVEAARLLVAAVSAVAGPVPRVVFVCTHNSARSQLAAAYWAGISRLPVAAAGTRPAPRVHPRAIEVGRRHGLRLGRARTRHVDDTVQQGDLVIAVCDQAHEELTAAHRPDPRDPPDGEGLLAGRSWLHWAVADPARIDTDEAFETTCRELANRVGRLAAALADADSGKARS